MAAGRKPAAHLRLLEDGRSPGRDSGGRKVPEPPPFARAVPEKPEGLSAPASVMWDAVVAELPRIDLLKPLDGFALRVGCETYARWHDANRLRRERENSGLLAKTSQGVGVSPLVRIESEASREFRAWCAEFGLTPAAEAKLSATADTSTSGDLF